LEKEEVAGAMKKTAIWLLAAAAAVVLAVWISRSAAPPAGGGAARVLGGFRPEQVSAIRIAGADSSVTLRLGENGWEVAERGGYPADHDRVLDLVRRAWELRPVQELPVAPQQRARLRLLPPETPGAPPEQTATRIDFLDKEENTLASLLLGKSQTRDAGMPGMPGTAVGRFVAANNQTAALVAEPFDDAAPSPKQWINRSMPPIEHPVSIERHGKDNPWKLSLQDDESWVLDNANTAPDQAKIAAIIRAWQNPSPDDVIPPQSPEATAFQPAEHIVIATRGGFTHTLKIGTSNGTTTPVRIESSPPAPGDSPANPETPTKPADQTIYLLPNHLVDLLVRDRDSLMPDPPDPEE
jgi:hypothetical protein